MLYNGFQFGFPLHFEGIRISFFATNLVSALQNPEIVSAKLSKELAANRIAGPFDNPPFPNFRVSPLGVVPKKTPGEYRLIHHLSFPNGASVNDGIAPEHTSVNYARVDDAVSMIKQLGRGCFLAKTDIKSAFRIIPIRPADYDLLGIFWQGKYYYDRVMPMGCASSCRTFEMFSTAIEWVAKTHLSIAHLIHILDDYLMAAPTYHQCRIDLVRFLSLCEHVGVPIAPEKTIGPHNVLSFAGIELDTLCMEARLPLDKTDKCKQLISAFLCRKKVTLREIQSLTGLLNFACSVVVPGRAFLRRLIDLTKGVRCAHHFIRLTKSVKADLEIWQSFLANFNGRSFFLNDMWHDSASLNLYTDSAASFGYGALFGFEWCYGAWPDNWKTFNITILEFYPIVLSVLLWGDQMRNQRITFFTDNAALVDIINKATSRDVTVMVFVRRLVLACLQFNILFRARHVAGVTNVLADSLSRLQVSKFKRLAPVGVRPTPTVIPPHLLPHNWPLLPRG
ncbi:uncharacterized protein LOC114525965 isoform X1 [Dendronephthya gigantea]|uniref:uncharacterized protein LOC114525965 isoform X1 n=1 Tax=Dendronephthya gigantea TaxID=151771 RepID=UPI00106A608A|nr:uncharacterized protein LOC114525965 isoform X1 [Dendronephthya gigantea]